MSVLAGSGCLRVRGRCSARLAVRRFRPVVGLAIRPDAAPAPNSAFAIRPDVSGAIRPVAAGSVIVLPAPRGFTSA
jgi:hypothetical protein